MKICLSKFCKHHKIWEFSNPVRRCVFTHALFFHVHWTKKISTTSYQVNSEVRTAKKLLHIQHFLRSSSPGTTDNSYSNSHRKFPQNYGTSTYNTVIVIINALSVWAVCVIIMLKCLFKNIQIFHFVHIHNPQKYMCSNNKNSFSIHFS